MWKNDKLLLYIKNWKIKKCKQENSSMLYKYAISWFQISGIDCKLQSKLSKDATLAPVIIITDRTYSLETNPHITFIS